VWGGRGGGHLQTGLFVELDGLCPLLGGVEKDIGEVRAADGGMFIIGGLKSDNGTTSASLGPASSDHYA
jgi:hypothetical protein